MAFQLMKIIVCAFTFLVLPVINASAMTGNNFHEIPKMIIWPLLDTQDLQGEFSQKRETNKNLSFAL